MKQKVTQKLNVLITGASSGIGNMTAVYFAKKGHTVFGTSRNPEKIDKKADELFSYIRMDVTDDASVNETIQTLLQKIEKIDIVICNAGMGISGPIETTPIEYIEKQINTNFWGTLRVLRSVLPGMREKGGKIFIIGSMAGRAGIPFQGYYAASKFALEGLVESLRYELMGFPV
ncbi:MAG TPA: SDR family NAD(P)-dependent oxidoreductase, partial [Spirochaetales bacterium]|nr:SDR family NAD(P)-dependent oxidoreductase [Spirochaetales bacterium]